MSEDLLKTKLFAPPVRPNQVLRKFLLEKFESTRQIGIQFNLVSAPAGFGKTSLVSEWIHASGLPFSWLTLDENDNDPVRFWRYMQAALEMADADIGKSLRPVLYSVQPPDTHQVVTRLVNDILNTNLEFILVIEDYHVIEHIEVHKSMNFLLDHLPPQMHLILTTRSDPPLNLALRRGRGQMAEIRAVDLRFTPEESTQFLNQNMHLNLTGQDIEMLNQRTEGWITGLQMAALSLQDEFDRHAFISAFSGDDRYIADYLIEEVLLHQPVEFQQFLLQTSILDRLTAPLCDAITGRQDSQALLNTLVRANLFILPLDNHREWFRYHRLFAELLHRRLLQTEGEQILQALRQRATDWLVENGFPRSAVEYAVDSANYELAARLIVVASESYFMSNDFNTLLKLGERLPQELIQNDIPLSCILAWAANTTAQIQKCEEYIHGVEASLGVTIDEFIEQGDALVLPDQGKAGLIELGVIRARMDVDTFNLERTFRLADHLLPYLTQDRDSQPIAFNLPSNLRGPMMFIQGLAQYLCGDIILAGETFQKAAVEGERTSNLHIRVLSQSHLGEAQLLQGRLREAHRTFQQILAVPTEILHSSPFFGISQAGLGALAYEWNDLDAAEIYFQSAIDLGILWRNWENLLPGYTGMAALQASRESWQAAYESLEHLLENTQESQGIVIATVESFRALLNLRRGDIESAARWAEAFKPKRPQVYRLAWEADDLIRSRVWIAAGEPEKARNLLERIQIEANTTGRTKHLYEALCLQALLFNNLHQEQEAHTFLTKALKLTAPERYIRTYIDLGEPMQELLNLALKRGWLEASLEPYALHLLSAFKPAHARANPVQGLIEPLSERELEVLSYLAKGLTNPEIARHLFLSPNTLKAHTQNIYAKLNVHNRVNAVNRAKELGLI